MVWGDFLLFVFLFGGFVCFCFVFLGKKKKTLAFSVCTAAGQDIIEVFLKIKEEK